MSGSTAGDLLVIFLAFVVLGWCLRQVQWSREQQRALRRQRAQAERAIRASQHGREDRP